MGNIKAFIFDMDGVLTETSEMHYKAWKSLAASIDLTIDRAFNEQLKGVSRRDSINKILLLSNETYSEERILTLMTQKNDAYVNLIKETSPENVCEGILPLLKKIKKENIKIAVASASHSAPLLLKLLEIEKYVDFIVDPGTVKSKPSPEIFLAAARGLEVNTDECIGIEDAEAGVEAIVAAFMFAVGIGNKQLLRKADLIYTETSEISFEEIVRGFYEKNGGPTTKAL